MERRLDRLDKIVPDQGIREYILSGFDEDDWFEDDGAYPNVCSNIINLAFMYAFSCYNDLNNRLSSDGGSKVEEVLSNKKNANAARVIQTMRKLYIDYSVTYEIIQFILTDIFFDFEMGDKSALKNFFPMLFDSVAPSGLTWYFNNVNDSIGNNRSDIERKVWRAKLLELIDIFPFLKRSSLVFDEERGWYVFNIEEAEYFPKGIVNTFGTVTKISGGILTNFYYLAGCDDSVLKYGMPDYTSFVECKLVGYDGQKVSAVLDAPFEIHLDEEYVFSYINHERCGLITNKMTSSRDRQSSRAIDQLFNINYKYLKNLALAISDALGREDYPACGEALMNEYRKSCPDAFEKFDAKLNNWDSVVLMLLIEIGPSVVLKKILTANYGIGVRIVENLKKRLGTMLKSGSGKDVAVESVVGKLNAIESVVDKLNKPCKNDEDKEDFVRIHQLKFKDRVLSHDIYEEMKRNLIAEKMTNQILSAIANRDDDDSTDLFYIGNIFLNIDALEKIDKEYDTPEEKCGIVMTAFADMVKKITCFYEGLFAYGEVKLQYERESAVKMLSDDELEAFQERAEEAFKNAVSNTRDELNAPPYDRSVVAVLKRLEAVDKHGDSNDAISISKIEVNKRLYTVTGKHSVFGTGKLSSVIKTASLDDLQDLNESNVDEWIAQAIDILKFFVFGNSSKKSFDSIAPYICDYANGNDSRGGYHTATFSLVFDGYGGSGKDSEVKVLTEFKYNMSSKYYCLPNIGRANDKWWIDPFIIKCQIFDDVFDEQTKSR